MLERLSKKYRVSVTTSGEPREVHDNVQGKVCYPAYFKVFERGWFLCEMSDVLFPTPVHRIHTSCVQNLELTDKGFIVHTANTKYEFTEITEDDGIDAES